MESYLATVHVKVDELLGRDPILGFVRPGVRSEAELEVRSRPDESLEIVMVELKLYYERRRL